MNRETVRWVFASALVAILATDSRGTLFTWDAGGGAGNEGWSYQSGGAYLNWATDPAGLPGASDAFKITGAGALSVLDANFNFPTPAHNSSVTAGAPGATLAIPAGRTLVFGGSVVRTITVGAAANEMGTIVVGGQMDHAGTLAVGGAFPGAVGTLTITNGTFNKVAGNTSIAGASPNTAGTAGPVGILNVHGGTFNVIPTTIDLVVAPAKTAGSTLTSVGILDLRNGTILINGTVGNGRSLILGAGDGSGVALVRGYGKIGSYTPGIAPLFRLRLGTVTADGENANRDLDLSECTYNMEVYENAASDTNGWYALRKGRILLPQATIDQKASYIFGENAYASYGPIDTDPDFVNSVAWSNVTYEGATGSLTNQGALLALDRDGLTLPVPENGALAVWEFTPNKAVTNVARLVFRYDHVRAAALGLDEAALSLYLNSGSGWTRIESAAANPAKHQLVVSGLAVPAGTARFAIGAQTRFKGTVVQVK